MAGVATTYVKVSTEGSAGSATGSGTSPVINGFILGVFFNFHASAPATTDTTVSYGTPALGNLIVLTNTATDVYHMPRKQAVDATGTVISGVWDLFPVSGTLSIELAGCDELTDALVATILYFRAD